MIDSTTVGIEARFSMGYAKRAFRLYRPVMRSARIVFVLLAILAAETTSVEADLATTPGESPYIAPEGKALVVFVRKRKRLASEVIYSIVNERGRCIASVANDWKVVARVEPGTQMLMVVTGVAQPQVQLLKVKAEAGKTYVVKMRPRVNAKNPVELTILRRSTEPLEMFPASLRETGPFKPNLEECTAWVAKRQSKLATKAARAKEAWKAADKEFRASHTIRGADGWTGDEVTGPVDD
ncbi:MAG: hypothetical protein OEM15_00945 [Myxococcales bacterium]|nr:hypothetical protein [Myxococcales bacterium]